MSGRGERKWRVRRLSGIPLTGGMIKAWVDGKLGIMMAKDNEMRED